MPIQKHSSAWKTKESAEIWEVRAYGGHVIHCTEEHPIATPNGYVNALCLQKGDKVVVLDRWNKFGPGKIPVNDSQIVFNDELAELVGWITAISPQNDEIKFTFGKERVSYLLNKYFPDTPHRETANILTLTLSGALKNLLRHGMKYNSSGFPENVNCFSKSQLISFFYPLFFLNGKCYKKTTTIKTILKGRNPKFLEFCKEHLNKLGLHGNVENWIGENLVFQCQTNFIRLRELFGGRLPEEYFPVFHAYKNMPRNVFLGEDEEELTYAKVHSVKKTDILAPVWDTTVEGKGWFLCSGAKVSNSGKTTAVAMITAACMVILPSLAEKFPQNFGMYSRGFWVGCFGPIGEQAVTMFDRIYDVFTTDSGKKLFIEELKLPIPARGGARGNLIALKNKSFVRYQSGSKRAKVESKTYHLIILDECQDIEAFKITKSILPSGAAVNATTVATGTPDVYVGFFYDMIEQNKASDLKNPSSKQLHFETDYTIAQKYNPSYKRYIQKEIKSQGFNSESFKMAYRLIWPITKGMVFTKGQLEETCYDKSLKTVKEWKESSCIAGLDLGKKQDSTIVTIIRPFWGEADAEGNMPKQLLDWLELEGDNWEEQYDKVIAFLGNYDIDSLICDSTGVGDPISERYGILLPRINVVPFIFSPTSKDRAYKYLIQEVSAKRLIIPAHSQVRNTQRFKKFEYQMTTLKKNYSGKFLNPCAIDQDKGHDDFCDSLALAVFGTFWDILPEIDIEDNNIYKTQRGHEEFYNQRYSTFRKERR